PTLNAFGIPNSPYYGLGPEDGSPCDTLGIDHHPQADFRYVTEASTVNFYDYSRFFPTAWHWTFGDGGSSTERDPVHVYAASGVYEVCLIVSNANASDTLCQFVEVIVTGTEEALAEKALLKVFPNPAKEYVFLQIPGHSDSNLDDLEWVLYDALGREMRRVALEHPEAQTVVNLENVVPGMYFWRLQAGGIILQTGKLSVVK
ncbi:MAG: PKD domain-containing protein, partial [Saprospiraceae bacterium]|nr:PKD domain-containing protein [Saprospiraceae bacterium]MDZ4702995.1 PKD domain-containing protein [Saprospiraceae bacterium]